MGRFFEYEINYLNAGLEELEVYLLSRELYWPIGIRSARGQKEYPKLTLGNLTLSQKKAGALADAHEQELALGRVNREIEKIHDQWQSAWGKKATQEYRSRFKLWRDFLDDYRKQPLTNTDRYGYEAGRRVLLELLISEADAIQDDEKILTESLDRFLRSIFVPGEFIWGKGLEPGFPKDPYWYLYGKLRD